MTVTTPAPASAPPSAVARHRRSLLGSVWHNPNGRVGCVLVGLVILGAVLGAFGATPYNPQFQNALSVLKSPSLGHLAGTDQFGRDEFSLVLEGLYVSLKISCVAVLIAGTLGTVAGIVAGYLGHWTSVVIMRATDMLFAIPAIVLALAIVTALGPAGSTAPWLSGSVTSRYSSGSCGARYLLFGRPGTSWPARCSASPGPACCSAISCPTSPVSLRCR